LTENLRAEPGMAETIHREEGGAPPGGMPPNSVEEYVARASEAVGREKELDPDRSYGRVEHDFVGPAGDPGSDRPGPVHGPYQGRCEVSVSSPRGFSKQGDSSRVGWGCGARSTRRDQSGTEESRMW
jgi:hypothetical protein